MDFLDEKVALAFRHLKLPAEWNVLGADQSLTGEDLWGTVRFAGWERGEKPGRKGSLPWELSMYLPKGVVASVLRDGMFMHIPCLALRSPDQGTDS